MAFSFGTTPAPAAGGFSFGGTPAPSTAAPTGGFFGAPAPSTTTAAPSTSLFGAPSSSTSSGGLFGSTPAPSGGLFGAPGEKRIALTAALAVNTMIVLLCPRNVAVLLALMLIDSRLDFCSTLIYSPSPVRRLVRIRARPVWRLIRIDARCGTAGRSLWITRACAIRGALWLRHIDTVCHAAATTTTRIHCPSLGKHALLSTPNPSQKCH